MTKTEYRSKGQNHVYREQKQTKQKEIVWTHTKDQVTFSDI